MLPSIHRLGSFVKLRLRHVVALGLLGLVAGPAASARGAWVPTPPVDAGPGVLAVGGSTLAPDGGGALVEVKRDGAGNHIGLATLVGGAWQVPQRVDSGQDGTSGQPVVAVRSGGGLIVAWINEGNLYAAVRPSTTAPLGPPTLIYRDPRSNGVVLNPSLSLSVNGAAYLGFTTATAPSGASSGPLLGLQVPGSPYGDPSLAVTGAGTIFLARFDRRSWSVLAAPMNVDPGRDAGRGANRPAVTAGADGTAVVAWGEVVGGTTPQVFLRRVDRGTPSAFPQQVSVSALDGHAGAGADRPSLGLRYDTSFGWVVLRQEFYDGGSPHSRAIARNLVGDGLGPPVAVDGLAFGGGDGATTPALALDGRGRGFAVAGTQTTHAVVGAHLGDASVFGPGLRIDSTANSLAPVPAVAAGTYDSQLVGWEDDPGSGPSVHARVALRGVFGPEAVTSPGAVDPAGGLAAGMDKYGDAALGFVQVTGAGRQAFGALYAPPPTAPRLRRRVVASRNGHPAFSWRPSLVQWGGPTYQVLAGRNVVGTTRKLSLTARRRVREGVYVFRVLAIDRFGQATPSAAGRLLVDSKAPTLSVSPGGARSAGGTVTLQLAVRDRAPSSGLRPVRVSWGDGSTTRARSRATHVYASPGHYRVRIVAADNAGNARVVVLALTIA